MKRKEKKRFYTKCCGSDIEYNPKTEIEKCFKCKKTLRKSDILENLEV